MISSGKTPARAKVMIKQLTIITIRVTSSNIQDLMILKQIRENVLKKKLSTLKINEKKEKFKNY